ncbi:MAG: hypothetical protein A2015_05180 [Spirochaetes bacterium GWF1_31_7]|nr:MAG: hypothetical protein A2Y30_06575 [Spirochaetes bacterium GWE1_32_154]OHD47237.1 MAG: hypothetical protein A2015_05180 [Spirochaetes bacterium GWF1_31_7]OHD52803.1 MAG: hypothetical protein A2Y29_15525 [Spirochaetes bacterium GWE2_31_10]HBD94285.1 hypothetical protein [Spirochaetia bacterium]HBI36170.1 hypothetical protein [Spirochaetia bacterium]
MNIKLLGVILFFSVSIVCAKDKISYNDFFDSQILHDIEIRISATEWKQMLIDLKANPKDGLYRKADFIYHDTSGDTIIKDVGFRIRGNTTRRIPYDVLKKKYNRDHFKIKFNEKDKTKFAGLNTLNLKWNLDKDDSQMRELYNYDFLNRAGVKAPQTASTRLTITVGNKKVYYGIYTAIEPINKGFLTKRYGKSGNKGDLYKCLWQSQGPAVLEYNKALKHRIGVKKWKEKYSPSYDAKTNSKKFDKERFIDFVKNITELQGDDFKQYITNNFEVDSFLKWLSANVLLGMPDDYWAMGNNYYLYLQKNGKVEFLPYDYDNALGGGWYPFDIANAGLFSWADLVKEYAQKDFGRPLMKILEVPEWREQYIENCKYLIDPANKLFVYSDYEARFDALKKIYQPYLQNDTGEGQVMVKEDAVRNYFYKRTLSVVKELNLNPVLYEIGEIYDDSDKSKGGNAELSLVDGVLNEKMTAGNNEPAGDGVKGPFDAPQAIYTGLDSQYIYIFVPLNTIESEKRQLSVLISNPENTVKMMLKTIPSGIEIVKDKSWNARYPEADIYYVYDAFSQEGDTNSVGIQKNYYDAALKTWGVSSNTKGTFAAFGEQGFEMMISRESIHAEEPGKAVSIGVVITDKDGNVTDSYGGDNSGGKKKRVYVASTIVLE